MRRHDCQRTVAELARNLAGGDHETAAKLFGENGVLEDLTLQTAVAETIES